MNKYAKQSNLLSEPVCLSIAQTQAKKLQYELKQLCKNAIAFQCYLHFKMIQCTIVLSL